MAITFGDLIGEGPTALAGVDERLARLVLSVARTFTPRLDSLDTLEGQPRLDALAILQTIALDAVARGSRGVRSRSRNGTSVTYTDVQSAFDLDQRRALRGLCTAVDARPGLPLGSFPVKSSLANVWSEGEYS